MSACDQLTARHGKWYYRTGIVHCCLELSCTRYSDNGPVNLEVLQQCYIHPPVSCPILIYQVEGSLEDWMEILNLVYGYSSEFTHVSHAAINVHII